MRAPGAALSREPAHVHRGRDVGCIGAAGPMTAGCRSIVALKYRTGLAGTLVTGPAPGGGPLRGSVW
jgi:hypothetical protein